MPSVRPKSQRTGSSDIFQTPPSALFPLIPFLKREWTLWECACGEGNLANWLRDVEGFNVIATDRNIGECVDFLYCLPDSDWDCVITNPPFRRKKEFIARCYELKKPWALLLPYTALEARKSQKLFDQYGIDILFLSTRPKFKTPSGKVGGAWFPVAWFTFGILPERIMFETSLP